MQSLFKYDNKGLMMCISAAAPGGYWPYKTVVKQLFKATGLDFRISQTFVTFTNKEIRTSTILKWYSVTDYNI